MNEPYRSCYHHAARSYPFGYTCQSGVWLEENMRELINGAQAIVRAAIDAGCTFFAGYPITPATDILLYMIRELPKVGGIAIQAEDEIASMGFCIGAALSGRRGLTATSGPGISLYSENIWLGAFACRYSWQPTRKLFFRRAQWRWTILLISPCEYAGWRLPR